MIVPGSRYTDSPLVTVAKGTRTVTVITASPPVPYQITYYWYQLAQGDTLSLLAAQNFGDPTLWWKIADANPEVLDWTSVAPGSLLRIPVIS